MAAQVGIHPGVLLITVIVACECWFFHYQDGAYQIVYYSTQGESFSHAQAQTIMCARFVVVLIALVVSVPYWQMLGFIQ